MKRRGRIDIIADMLTASLHGAKKTHIMNRSNLNFKLLSSYLGIILSAGLLTFDSAEDTYFVTEKGKNFISGFSDYKQHLHEAVNKMNVVRAKKRRLEEMCFPKKSFNDLERLAKIVAAE